MDNTTKDIHDVVSLAFELLKHQITEYFKFELGIDSIKNNDGIEITLTVHKTYADNDASDLIFNGVTGFFGYAGGVYRTSIELDSRIEDINKAKNPFLNM